MSIFGLGKKDEDNEKLIITKECIKDRDEMVLIKDCVSNMRAFLMKLEYSSKINDEFKENYEKFKLYLEHFYELYNKQI